MSSTGSMTLPKAASPARRARSRSRGRKVLNPVTGRMVKVGGRAYRKAHGLVKPRRKASRSPRRKASRSPRRRVARRSPKKMVARSPRRMARRSPRKTRRSPRKHVAKLSPKVRRGRLAGGSVLRCRVVRKTRSPKKM